MRAVLDFKNASQFLDMTSDALRDLVKHEAIPFKKRGSKLIFLIEDLQAWLRALPGPNANDIPQERFPATFRDPLPAEIRHLAPSDTSASPDIPFVRGPRRHKAAPSVPQGMR